MTGPVPLNPDTLRANLKTTRIGRQILVYNVTSSTNDVAAEYSKNKRNDGLVVFAEEQSEGRGRAGSRWHSDRGQSILCSILLTDSTCGTELLSLAFAVAVAEAIGKVGAHEARIKWPNDIRLGDKKVAGILLESKANNRTKAYIIGVGINCHQKTKSFPVELRDTATSIDIESASFTDRISLAKRLLVSMDRWLAVAESDSSKITNRWRKLSIQLSHRITLLYGARKFSGNCIGIDPQKGLILQLDTGAVRMFDAAHTSIVQP